MTGFECTLFFSSLLPPPPPKAEEEEEEENISLFKTFSLILYDENFWFLKTREKKTHRERKESTGPSQKTNQNLRRTKNSSSSYVFFFFALYAHAHTARSHLHNFFLLSRIIFTNKSTHTRTRIIYIYINNAQKDDSECEICEEQREEERDVLFLVCVAVVRGLFSLSGFCFGER